jgi:hypothetical protein
MENLCLYVLLHTKKERKKEKKGGLLGCKLEHPFGDGRTFRQDSLDRVQSLSNEEETQIAFKARKKKKVCE